MVFQAPSQQPRDVFVLPSGRTWLVGQLSVTRSVCAAVEGEMDPGSEEESQALATQDGVVPELHWPVVPSHVMLAVLGVSW